MIISIDNVFMKGGLDGNRKRCKGSKEEGGSWSP